MVAPFPPVLFELINCLLWTFSAAVLVIVGRYFLAHAWTFWRNRWHEGVMEAWRTRDRMASALLVTVIGEVGIRFWSWVSRYLTNTHHDITWMASARWGVIPVLFCIVEAWGWCCVARVLAPDAWGRWGWPATLLFSGGVLTGSLMIR